MAFLLPGARAPAARAEEPVPRLRARMAGGF